MGQRCTQQRPAAASGSQAGHHGDFRGGAAAPQLIHQGSHAINAAVAGADQRHILVLRFLQRQSAALCLPGHGGGKQLLAGIALLHQIHIHGVAHNQLALPQSTVGSDGHIVIISGANAHDCQFTQSEPPNFPAPRQRLHRPGHIFLQSTAAPPPGQPAHTRSPPRSRRQQIPTR